MQSVRPALSAPMNPTSRQAAKISIWLTFLFQTTFTTLNNKNNAFTNL